MKSRKVCIILTTRGNYAKMKSVMRHIEARPELDLQVILGGGLILARYGSVLDSLQENNQKIDRVIHFMVEGENPVAMAKSAGLAVTEFSTAFENMRPDVVLVIADRFECLPIAMAASYMNIPLAHVEGGEVSGSIDESVRHAITKLSHLHFPATKEAAERLKRLGEDPHSIFPVGCTSLDILAELDLEDTGPLREIQKRAGIGAEVDFNAPYLLVIQHPVTTEYEQNLRHVNETIRAIENLRLPTAWIWPNIDAGTDGISKGIRIFRERKRPDSIRFFKSLPIEYFGPLLKNAACIVGNSSSGIREASFLGVPCVNVGSRQQGRERGRNTRDVPYDCDGIMAAVLEQVQHGPFAPEQLYGDGRAGYRMAQILGNFQFKVQKRINY